ncbi:uncharacterized protein LOC115222616 [Octopus sinensis]|uniref:Uncharacterized protein LOC115222616 n=1 Tax=Octopus sinensis TaxID=2607531 RepID=A0A6P7TCJ5_9MOLL|nr:uncharacterized protein LOC115222616 [Octopus sinensis]
MVSSEKCQSSSAQARSLKILTMSKTNAVNKLARNYSLSKTQLTPIIKEENVKQPEREIPASPTSDKEMSPANDSSFLSIEDLMLSQTYNPNSDVAWQVASPEVLRKIHKAIIQDQKLRKKKSATLNKDEKDAQQAVEKPMVNTPVIARPKWRVKMKKKVSSRIEDTIKTIEMKMKSDKDLACCGMPSQRNPTSPSSDLLCSEACNSHSSEHCPSSEKDSDHFDEIKKATSDDNIVRESETHLLSDEEIAWSEEELLCESVVETALVNESIVNSTENSSAIRSSNENIGNSKIQNNLKDTDQSSCQKTCLSKGRTPSKIQKGICSENPSSVSEDMNLSDTDIDEMLSQLQETDFVSSDASESTVNVNSETPPQDPVPLDLQQNHNTRVTRSMVKKTNVQVLDSSDQVNQKSLTKNNKNRTNESDTALRKAYLLRNSTVQQTETGVSSKASVPVSNNAQQHYLSAPKRGEDLFDDSEITDELLVGVYEDMFKDDMEDDNSTAVNQISEPKVRKVKNEVCSKEEIERKKLEALKRRNNYRSKTKRK